MENTMMENQEVVEMENGFEGYEETAASYEEMGVDTEMEATGNQGIKMAAVGVGSAVAGAVGGWIGRGFFEKRKRQVMYDEIQKQLCLIGAKARGLAELEWQGKVISTAGINVSTTEELKAYIMEKVLGNMKLDKNERKSWSDLLTTIVELEDMVIRNEKIVVNEK